jgi:hypothetical protein
MKISMKIFAITILALFALTGSCCADGLGTLIDLAQGQAAIAGDNTRDTKVYERVKSAVENGSIVKGQSKSEIKDRYGEPVVILPKEYGRPERWFYKPAKSSFFSGEKITFCFDENNKIFDIIVEK